MTKIKRCESCEHPKKKCRKCKKLICLNDFSIANITYHIIRPDCKDCENEKKIRSRREKQRNINERTIL